MFLKLFSKYVPKFVSSLSNHFEIRLKTALETTFYPRFLVWVALRHIYFGFGFSLYHSPRLASSKAGLVIETHYAISTLQSISIGEWQRTVSNVSFCLETNWSGMISKISRLAGRRAVPCRAVPCRAVPTA